ADGWMIDPPVSVPIENATSPAAVAEPGPADDPDASCAVFQGFRVRPPNHCALKASAPDDSLATRTAPASRSLVYTVASVSTTWSRYGDAPQVVFVPRTANRSFKPKGIPWSGLRYRPAAISSSACAACLRAASSVRLTTQWSVGSYFFRRER